jgi:hypothetical protein
LEKARVKERVLSPRPWRKMTVWVCGWGAVGGRMVRGRVRGVEEAIFGGFFFSFLFLGRCRFWFWYVGEMKEGYEGGDFNLLDRE